MLKTAALTLFSIGILSIANVSPAYAQQYMITIAGTGVAGNTGDHGLATLAEFTDPANVCFDNARNLYIDDLTSRVIRKVNATTGIITTIAGTGAVGYSGDGGPATAATFSDVDGMVIDAAGNIYISDQGAQLVRKVDAATGIIHTIAGVATIGGYTGDGLMATAAKFNGPSGMCLDASGNLYIADLGNNVIRKIDAVTGIITTVVGNGAGAGTTAGTYTGDGGSATAAGLSRPKSVGIDSIGNMYIADYGNYVIRKVSGATNIITTIAGNGSAFFSGDGGPATTAGIGSPYDLCVDHVGNVYLVDITGSTCRKVSAATGLINIIAGESTASGYNGDGGAATAEWLKNPSGICIDPLNGDVIIVDGGNSRVRKVTSVLPEYVGSTHTAPSLKIQPNPCSGKFTLITGHVQTGAVVAIYNMGGAVVYSTSLTGSQNNIDISSQPPGTYYLVVRSVVGVQSQMITISN